MNTKTNATTPMCVAFLSKEKSTETDQRFKIDGQDYYHNKSLPICCEMHARNFQLFYVKYAQKNEPRAFHHLKTEHVILAITWFDQDNEISKMQPIRFADLAKELPQ